MGLMKKYFNNTRKPEGKLGEMMVNSMNGNSHKRLAEWGLGFIKKSGFDCSLDVGCGGGANVHRLLEISNNVYGADYSAVSVKKSKEFNAEAIAEGRCEIIEADVRSLPFENEKFELVTAFETVYFWKDIDKAFSEINRILKPGGIFLITNESTGTDKTSVKFSEIIDGMSLYTAEQLEELLKKAGFSEVSSHKHKSKPWISVMGNK